jgi:hypothetical protein
MTATSTLQRFLLDRLYPTALDGLPGLGTPQALAEEVRAGGGTLDEQAERLVLRHLAAAGAAGFASGLGGWLTLPLVLPANLAGVALLQLHMAAAIAALGGHHPALPATRERVLACLVGVSPDDDARGPEQETFDRVGLKLAERGLNIVVTSAAQVARWGAKRLVAGQVRKRLLRGIPLVGGVIGAVSDGYVTAQVARAARDAFLGGLPERREPAPPRHSGDGLPDGVVAPSPAASA